MSSSSQQIFRARALERMASPEQLDHLVRVTRPADWVLAAVIALVLATAVTWSLVGRIPTRAAGEGILVGVGGQVVDAVSGAGGRLGAIAVAVGDRVALGQPIAEIIQNEIEQRYRSATEVYRERERDHADLRSKIASELQTKAANFVKVERAFDQIVQATDQRIDYLATEVRNLETLLAKGITTRRTVEDRRRELIDARQRREDAQNELLKLKVQKTDLEVQRDREIQESQFRINDARRQMEQIGGELGRNTRVVSPIAGRVLEIKVSPGSVLGVGTPVVAVETEGQSLEAIVYIPADKGKQIRPGMEARLEPSTVKREEYGTLVGTVMSISDFPLTPQGMLAVLHNDTLVSRFSREGAPYAALIRLQPDPATASGYRWAVGRGPDQRLSSGTLTRAEITTREQRPLDLALPTLKRLTGIAG
ncbi:membrane protein [Methylobacterium variabile]|uniref:Membrane protein n=1 Tax=Methylobacterium variabile TaxID=298794 RepID=A0A0J6SYN0_9HYPH|nr:NHLP bacteriocin system secretion protein [Methylobacterium variabile]KMO38428.1 membrane protein [Methylobacterium variabile]